MRTAPTSSPSLVPLTSIVIIICIGISSLIAFFDRKECISQWMLTCRERQWQPGPLPSPVSRHIVVPPSSLCIRNALLFIIATLFIGAPAVGLTGCPRQEQLARCSSHTDHTPASCSCVRIACTQRLCIHSLIWMVQVCTRTIMLVSTQE